MTDEVTVEARVGEPAPDFSLPGTHDGEKRDHTLSEYRGQPVVLVFYPGDNTPVCTRQLNSYTRDVERFAAADAQVLAISPQSVESHEAFAEQQGGFAFPLLADTDKAVGEVYGIIGFMGLYRRSVFVVDGDGVLRWLHRHLAGTTFQATDRLVEVLDDLA